MLSLVQLFAIPWTVACQAPLSMEFSRQEQWSGLPCPSPGDLPNPGIDLGSSALQANSLLSEPRSSPLSHQGNHLPKTTLSHWSLGFQCTVLMGYEHSDHKQILYYLELIVLADRGCETFFFFFNFCWLVDWLDLSYFYFYLKNFQYDLLPIKIFFRPKKITFYSL